MLVKELIELLRAMPGTARVMVIQDDDVTLDAATFVRLYGTYEYTGKHDTAFITIGDDHANR